MDDLMKVHILEELRKTLDKDGVYLDERDQAKVMEFLDKDMSIDELIDYFKEKDE
ncbi:hypothetical protein [Salisediminibacterium beveridgei]|uniref:hypothetical protein n=1 Tax=Salisediminibacterium beveridgei TaxID=632773 RepID=UPI0012EE730B|nr:hypothetical protein [Salisediminibacterium beveridgei]